MLKNTAKTYTMGQLQTYDECPQKYKLCYIDKVHIVESLRTQNLSQTGNRLHNLINYYLKGMDTTKLISTLYNDEKILWHNFITSEIKNYTNKASEFAFNVKIDNHWLTGRIDALFEYDENYIILDWKTGEHFRSENAKFQTSFYLLCMYEILRAKELIKSPEQLELHYMNLQTDSTIKIKFDKDLYLQYKTTILNIINEINTRTNFICNRTDKCPKCKYYRACPLQ